MQKENKFFTLALLSLAVIARLSPSSVSWRNIAFMLIDPLVERKCLFFDSHRVGLKLIFASATPTPSRSSPA